ncbi:hypothetical protein M758_4G215300 [Ceratodon purpureus]|nr:hypothetical protein M758_4G215300 [Ceratodon purpureus]
MESIRGGCGVPSHVQHHMLNFKHFACDDCRRLVRSASDGFYSCSKCDKRLCVSCAFDKQSQHGSTSNSKPASSSRSTAFSKIQSISGSDEDEEDDDEEDDDEEEMEEPILPCAGSFTHNLEFLQSSPYRNNSFGCNMCGQAGYGKLYHCDSCQFDAHTQCAEVEEQIKVNFHKHTLQRYYIGDDDDEEDDDEEFQCQCCQGYEEEDVSAWVYKCLQCDDFAVHARCAKYAQSLTHGSHPHKLKLVHKLTYHKKYKKIGCDACAADICHTYFYTCTKRECNFDLHPLCAVLPSKPSCRLNPTHRADIDYFTPADELCVLCETPSNNAWLYRCFECQVSMHVDCFGAETDNDSSDEEDDEEKEEEEFGELYQKFIDSIDEIGHGDDKGKVEMLSEVVNTLKSISEAAAASSFARQDSVKSKVQPKHTLTRTGTYIGDRELENSTSSKNSSAPQNYLEDNPQSTYSPGDNSSPIKSSESDSRDAEEVERRRVKRAAKEQRQKDKAAEKEQEKKEKEARRAEKATHRAHLLEKLEKMSRSGSNIAEVRALVVDLQAQSATQHKEDVKRSEERHLEQVKRTEERHLETVNLHHSSGKLHQERHLEQTKLQQDHARHNQDHITMEVQRMMSQWKLSGGNDTGVTELKGMFTQFATHQSEEIKRNQGRHAENVKLHQDLGKLHREQHLEQTKLQQDHAKHNQEGHVQSTKLGREQLEFQKEQAKIGEKRHLEQINLLHLQRQEYEKALQEIIRTQVQSTTRVVPRLVLCTDTKSKRKKLITSLRVGIMGMHLDLFCEHEQQPHLVEGAQGCEINMKVAGDRWTNLQPYLIAGLRVLMAALNFGVAIGTPGGNLLKDVVPDLPKIVRETLALDLGKHGLQPKHGAIVPRPEEEEAAAQSLVSYLKEQKVNIADCFKLYRVRYKAPYSVKGNVGWLCTPHLEAGKRAGCLEYFPVP